MMGYSLGGLTSCYAAYRFPLLFSRALCLSPSVWWNSGQLAQLIASSSSPSPAPKAVVIYIGTAEMEADLAGTLYQPIPWLQLIQETYAAFALNNSTVVSGFEVDGGFHLVPSWYA